MKYNNTPLQRILDARDPITGYKLVIFSKNMKKYIPNGKIPVCRYGEEHLVENYNLAKIDNFKGWVLHHRLELTIEGDFANSAIDLVNKEMYYYRPYFELIWLKRGEHSRLHLSGNKGTMFGISPDKHPMYGRTGDRAPMYGRKGDKSPNWKGDDVSERTKYLREYRAKKRSIGHETLLSSVS